MAPSHSRQLLVWTLPAAIAVLFGYLWFKKKKAGICNRPNSTLTNNIDSKTDSRPTKDEDLNVEIQQTSPRAFSRSLSGVESAPIDIKLPKELKASKSNPVVISDEDLDQEIEKIKSMKYGRSNSLKKNDQPEDIQGAAAAIEETVVKSVSSTTKESVMSRSNTSNQQTSQSQSSTNVEKLTEAIEEKNDLQGTEKSTEMNVDGTQQDTLSQEETIKDESEAKVQEKNCLNENNSEVHMEGDEVDEGSSDSGKGHSEKSAATVGSIASDTDSNWIGVFEFTMPQTLVGRLIGRKGSFVTNIREKTNCHVYIRNHPYDRKLKICALDGNDDETTQALKMIRSKFPKKRYPEITLEKISSILPPPVLVPDNLFLKLIEGINNDTLVSCVIAPDHVFLQQPIHPTFQTYNMMIICMNNTYNNDLDAPLLPNNFEANTICVVHTANGWYRALVLSTDPEAKESYIKFVDCGGYAFVPNANLKQIRQDFMVLPFQATECYLANIRPANNETEWKQEAYDLVSEMSKGLMNFSQVIGYDEHHTPLIKLFIRTGTSTVSVSDELVKRGFAEYFSEENENN